MIDETLEELFLNKTNFQFKFFHFIRQRREMVVGQALFLVECRDEIYLTV